MKATGFFRTGFFSLLAAAFFTLLPLAVSCSNSSGTRYVEVAAQSSAAGGVTFAIKEASYILHYQQKVMTDEGGKEYVSARGEGFELVQSEDKSASPVAAGTQFKALAKNFLGFSYSYAVQKDKTVFIYYTRNTVEYSFYKNNQSKPLELLAKISGTHGFTCVPPSVTIDGKAVTGWKDSIGAALPEKFTSENRAFFSTGTGIGTKARPTATGDIVFCDGTAASIADVNAAWKSGDPVLEEYKQNAIAAIVFDRYNAETGSASGGDKIIGVGIQALNGALPASGERYKTLFKKIWRFNDRPNPYRSACVCSTYHGYYDLRDLENLFGPFDKTSFSNDWTAIYKAVTYGDTLKENGGLNVADKLLDGWYLPNWQELALLLASNYNYKETLNAACDALGIDRPHIDAATPTNSDLFWATASKVNGSDNKVYAVFVNAANTYTPFKALMGGDNFSADYWKDVDEKCQILPFREFK